MAFLCVFSTLKLPLTPNHFSLLALLCAIFSGFHLVNGDANGFFWGGVGIILFSIFDCCDGMVARLKKNGSELGELIDMFVDLLSNCFFFFGLYFGLKQNSENHYPWLIFVSALSIFANASIYNFYKKQFFSYQNGDEQWRESEKEKYEILYRKLEEKKGTLFWRFLIRFFFGFTKVQKREDHLKKIDIEKYVKLNEKMLPLWAISSGSTHLTVMAFALIINRIELFYYFSLGVFVFIPLLVGIIQLRLNQSVELA